MLPSAKLNESFPPYKLALELRDSLEENIDALYGGYSGEAKAMLLGDREDIGYATNQAYKGSGLMHLLCVSGLHVGIVCGGVLRILPGRKRWLRILLCLLLLSVYAALTGFSAPTLRAALMLLIAFILRLSAKQGDGLSALALSLSLLLLLNPAYISSLGFGLSFASLLGILLLSKPLTERIPLGEHPLIQLPIASVAAGLGAMPLFARLGGYAWTSTFISMLALPVYPLFLLPGWISILLYPLSPLLGEILALLPRGVLAFIHSLAYLGDSLPIALPIPGVLTMVFWFCGLFCLSPYFLPQRKKPPAIPLGMLGGSVLCWILGI